MQGNEKFDDDFDVKTGDLLVCEIFVTPQYGGTVLNPQYKAKDRADATRYIKEYDDVTSSRKLKVIKVLDTVEIIVHKSQEIVIESEKKSVE